jgi:hypothetical protein
MNHEIHKYRLSIYQLRLYYETIFNKAYLYVNINWPKTGFFLGICRKWGGVFRQIQKRGDSEKFIP